MKKIIFILSCLIYLTASGANASEYAKIYGQVIDNERLKEIKLCKIINGDRVEIASSTISTDGKYGFLFMPDEEGFYSIGNTPLNYYLVYLKAGCETQINIHRDYIELIKTNNKEEQTLNDWQKLSFKADLFASHFLENKSTYVEFFPEFQTLLLKKDNFKDKINTGNSLFDITMKSVVDLELDRMALNILYTPRMKYPQPADYPEYYKTILSKEKPTDVTILKLPEGMRLLEMYRMFFSDLQKQKTLFKQSLECINNFQLRGEIILKAAQRYKFYEEYLRMMDDYEQYFVTSDQKKRAESIGIKLSKLKDVNVTIDFTYPDINGKNVSLSDFNGKVVLVDVWATWCGPCRGEIPYLKKLEENMSGKDIIFLSVSLDVQKDKQKWIDMIKKEKMGGVHLFADGFKSKIAESYKITSIPRFMVFGKDGKIVSISSPRPSDIKLKEMLEIELKK